MKILFGLILVSVGLSSFSYAGGVYCHNKEGQVCGIAMGDISCAEMCGEEESLFFLSPAPSVPATKYSCEDSSGFWRVEVQIAEGLNVRGSLHAELQGWKVLDQNLNEAVPTHDGVAYRSQNLTETEFGIHQGKGTYDLKTFQGIIQLSCKVENENVPLRQCFVKGCSPDGMKDFPVNVPGFYQCENRNIQCKV